MKLNDVERSLERFYYDTFQVPENPLDPFEKLNVTFPANAHGESSTIQANREANVKEIVFTRAPEKRMFETSFRAAAPSRLRRSGARPWTVALAGDNGLQLILSGSAAAQVDSVGTNPWFGLQDRTGITAEIKQDASGQAQEIALRPAQRRCGRERNRQRWSPVA
jgi:hypothetical protein